MEYCLKGHFNVKSRISYLQKDVGQKCNVSITADFSQRHANACLNAIGAFTSAVPYP